MMTGDSTKTRAQEKYRPVFELGRGGMATVFLATSQGVGGVNKLQVVKQLRDELAGSSEFLAMFLDEARLSARIDHPNVVRTNEVGHDGKHYFIAMEYLEGQSFEAVLRRSATKGGLPLSMYLHIVSEALEGLHHAHELLDFDGTPLNVVHRDVSPQNIFITYDGVTKVLDFGIAKAADSTGVTSTGVIKGKVAYMAPEQLSTGGAKAKIDRRADVYAVGVILWRAITGKRLWKGMSDLEVFRHLASGDIPSALTVTPNADPALLAIVTKAMALKPADRYATAAEMRADVDALLATREPVTGKAIGKLVAELFAAHRAEVKAAVEARLKEPDRLGRSEVDVPLLDAQLTRGDTKSVGRIAVSAIAAEPATAKVVKPVKASPSASGSKRSPSSPPRVPIGTPPKFIVGAAVALASLAGAVAIAATSIVPPRPRDVPVVIVEPPPPPPVDLTIAVTPPAARVFVDDEPFTTLQQRFPRDMAKHWVHAEAPGYLTKAQLVAFDVATLSMQIDLEKKP
jgi:serine/threonine protein kinase